MKRKTCCRVHNQSHDSIGNICSVDSRRPPLRVVEEHNPDPEMSLLTYIRTKLGLTGTKSGCSEGGCGACTVMVSNYDSNFNKIVHRAVNACLAPVCSVHGAAVTTVEGIGSTKSKLHPVQERIALAHGTQCGFCTPGMVMSMYTLLRNNPHPSMEEIQAALGGNLCRCTGYRPILEGYKSFANDGGCCGGKCEQADATCEVPRRLYDPTTFMKYDATQDIIFPPELLLSTAKQNESSLTFKGIRVTWHRPLTLNELLDLKTKHPTSKLIGGNTYIGNESKFGNKVYPILIEVNHVQELKELKVEGESVLVGAAVTLSQMEMFLKEIITREQSSKTRTYQAIVEMLRWFAGRQIRDVVTIGGNIVTGSPTSDLNPIFMATKCTVELVSQSRGTRLVFMDEHFFTGHRKNIIEADEVLKSIAIPFTKKNEYVYGFKQSSRREMDSAIVNAAMMVAFDHGTDVISDITLSYGGMAETTVFATNTMQKLRERKWDESMLEIAFTSLAEDLPLPAGAPGGMEPYRQSLAVGFFFKFYLLVLQDLQSQQINVSSEETIDNSAIALLSDGPVKGVQFFQEVSSGQPDHDPVGRPISHKAAYQHATGEAVYIDDMPKHSNELHMAFVFSGRAHAKIVSIDTSNALAMEGVHDFISAEDVPGSNLVGAIFPDEELFATKEVMHIGQIIGAIVADTKEQAQRAAKEVKVSFDDLEAVITIEDAIEKESFFDCPVVLENGNLSEAFEKSDYVIEGELKVGAQEHFYMETQCACVVPKGEDGEFEVFCCTQQPSAIPRFTSSVLGVPYSRITGRVKRLGGAFGGKQSRSAILAAACAVAANKVGRPVRFMLERDEDMKSTGTRHPFLGRYKVGCTKDGKLVGVDIKMFSNGGFSHDVSLEVMDTALHFFENVYRLPVFRVEGRVCRTNLPSNGAFRAFGTPQAMIITETFMDDVAVKCKIPQHKVREMNFYKEGDITPRNQTIKDFALPRCWDECLTKSNYASRREAVDTFNRNNRWKKRGLAVIPVKFGVSFSVPYFNQAGALVHIYTDGSVLVTHGGIEMGQGLHTKMIQIAARTLGIPQAKIHLTETNTTKVPNASVTAASTGSDLNGRAIQKACETLKQRLEPYVYADPKGNWEGWIGAAYKDRVSLSAAGFYKTPNITYDREKNEGNVYPYSTYGVGVSEVEIDCLTGGHRTLRTDIVMDVGESINPAVDVGQIEGAFVQGYGLFVMEDLRWSPDGQLLTNGPGYYKIPSFGDVPLEFNVTLLKNSSNPVNICSSKACGEPPLFLGSSVFFAIKDAMMSARADEGLTGIFRLDSPSVAERIRLGCVDKFTKMFPSPEPGTFVPFFVRP
ncbi:xanthine dehydrogenase/oxidase-like [Lytechinus variegatus]|uniref:xanthine dehydrogenase/oxidase-like n=1 Tax=Lytechinus variegatus TaxID=7654 RepID=UPI001BB1202F|nr:xanthine dehydrogenase/oxidase-like [Lytechinus variegatus]